MTIRNPGFVSVNRITYSVTDDLFDDQSIVCGLYAIRQFGQQFFVAGKLV